MDLNEFSVRTLLLLSALMFIGRIGIFSLLLFLICGKAVQESYSYPEERIIIG
ncbi:MAG: hypothetical protein ACE3JP_03765 [Ectobacillus sp.]